MKFNLSCILFSLCTVFTINAQQATGVIAKEAQAISTTSAIVGYIKIVGNKGEQTFLQFKNGVTLLTNSTPEDGALVATLQLGGSLQNRYYH